MPLSTCYKIPTVNILNLQTTKQQQQRKLTSRISLLALGDVASLNSLMATGILTFSPSGIQRPCRKTKMGQIKTKSK